MRIIAHSLMFALIASQVTASVDARIVNASKHRKVDANGVGNCVFSAQPLPFKTENAPAYGAITTTFVEGQDVHARCYWGKMASEFGAAGKVFNSVRDEQRYRTSLIWQRVPGDDQNPGDVAITSVKTTVDGEWVMADQQRFDIYDRPDCDFKELDASKRALNGFSSPHNCADIASYLRMQIALNQRARANKPDDGIQMPVLSENDTFRICIQQNVIVADKISESRRWDKVSQSWRTDRQPFKYNLPMARGCFDYRLRA